MSSLCDPDQQHPFQHPLLDHDDDDPVEFKTCCRDCLIAIKADHLDCLQHLFRTDFISKVTPWKVFHKAVTRGSLPMLEYLHKQRCDTLNDAFVRNCVWSAVRSKDRACLIYLIENILCNWDKCTISLAADMKDLTTLRYLSSKRRVLDRWNGYRLRVWDEHVCTKLKNGCEMWQCTSCH